jgi:uncharacterized protein YegP (UPF0339 family)
MRLPRFEVYRDTKKEWRWRFIASNGRIMADSAEGYKTLSGASFAATKITRYIRFPAEMPEIKVLYPKVAVLTAPIGKEGGRFI